MSTQTTPGGPVIGIATFRTLITPESDDHAHTAQHAQVDHSHSGGGGGSLVEADIPENLGLQNLQIGDAGTYDEPPVWLRGRSGNRDGETEHD